MKNHTLSITTKVFTLTFAISAIALKNAEADDVTLYKALFGTLPKSAESKDNPSNPAKIKLGKQLYFEKLLSKNKDLSCNSCHNLETYGVDNQPTSPGHKGQLGDRNSPTSLNSALHFVQFWDGRAKDVEEQALGPVLNPVEMAMPNEQEVLTRLKASKEYPNLFKEAFPGEKDPLTFKNVGKAIGAFERTLITPSRFDKYMNGDSNALNDKEKHGLKLFVETGCNSCHQGPLFGAGMYQKLGLVTPYPTAHPNDKGRAKITGQSFDEMVFKVPSLRNVEKTYPYLHDGSIKSLDDAVKIMAKYQLGKTLDDKQTSDIVAFLKTLTGEKVKY